jgi:ring-1,2-phenylacetyl-CoA epoxidase subunit PaaE
MTSNGKKPILDELIDMKKNPPYSCTSGACSSCMAKVVSGKVEMEVCYALDDQDIQNGLILTCQAKAVTPEVEIVFDGI